MARSASATSLDLDRFRERAAEFAEELDREHYLHYAGHKPDLEVEAIYGRHSDLFTSDTVASLRDLSLAAPGDRRLRELLRLALDGRLGFATRSHQAEIARLEATLEVDAGWGPMPYRAVASAQANEPERGRRAALERAREAVLAERLNPIHLDAFEIERAILRELGWVGSVDAYSELRGIDLRALAEPVRRFLEATDDPIHESVIGPRLRAAGLPPLGELERFDITRLHRAPQLDPLYPSDRLVPSLAATLAGIGIRLEAQRNITLDTEPRATKSPRAFCSAPRAPEEVYLVVAPVGGRDDFAALFHEAGHTEHYAHVDPSLGFEDRQLGDNTVTESFAFLFEQLTREPAWLADHLGVTASDEVVAHSRAVRLYYLRRYAAKLAYELELGDAAPDLSAMPARYAELLGRATGARWPESSWLADVDGGFYVACYLRAWALETHWRAALTARFGPRWYAVPEAGRWLRRLWSQGQRLGGDELLAEELGERLDFARLAGEFPPAGST